MLKLISESYFNRHSKRSLLDVMSYVDFVLFKHKSHYASLGLKSDATSKEIKAAYYKLSLKFHPDKNKGSHESAEKFREISEAYEVLGNAEKKKNYDINLNSRYSESNWRDKNYSKSNDYTYRSSSTGKTKYYDYDEHYRQHYEEYKNYRKADYEYFRQRWEADYRRRHPFANEREWAKYRYQQTPVEFNWRLLWESKAFVYFVTLWILVFLSALMIEDKDKPKVKIIYYKVDDCNKSNINEEEIAVEKE